MPNANRFKYRIRTPESSSHVDHLPITALGDNPSNHSYTVHTRDLLKRYARHTDTTHQCPRPPYPPSKENAHIPWQAAARPRATADVIRYGYLPSH